MTRASDYSDKIKEWNKRRVELQATKPTWTAKEATYCSNPNAITYSPSYASVGDEGAVFLHGLSMIYKDDAVSLARFLLDVYAEKE